MDALALLLSRLQFAFTISFHIIFPAFSIGLAAWLTVLETLYLWTGRPAYRVVFDFWLKIFGVAFALGVVSGIVMAFQFGTNWSVLSRMAGPIQGVLLSYETFTACVGGQLLWRPGIWPVACAALALSAFNCNGGLRHVAFCILDHGQQ